MAASDAKPVPVKNAAYRITFPIYDADGDLVTGATGLDSEVSKDGGTFADCTNEATEIATSSGVYYLDLTSTEMNADTVAIIVKTSSSGAKTTIVVLNPQEAGDIKVDVETISDDATAASNAEAFFDGTGYAGTNNVIPTVTSLTNGVNVAQISGDSTAADNLEAALDGTGGVTITAGITGNITGNLSGSVGSVTGAVGSVTGAVGSVTGSVGSIATGGISAASFAVGAIDAAAIAADAIGSSELAASAVAEIADQVWDEVLSGHLTAGTTGAGLNAAGSAGDPWSTALPGAYGAGSAGYILGSNLDATITSRASQAGLDDVPTVAEFNARTLVAANYATTADLLTIAGDIGTIDAAVAAIQSKTDNLPASPASSADGITAADVRDAIGLESANLDTQLGDVPTVAEFEARTLLAASYATASALSTVADNVVLVLDDTGTAGVVLSGATCNKIADHVRRRTQANVEASSDGDALSLLSLYGVIQQIQEGNAVGTTLTVYRTDGTTSLGTRTLATDPAAEPVTGVS